MTLDTSKGIQAAASETERTLEKINKVYVELKISFGDLTAKLQYVSMPSPVEDKQQSTPKANHSPLVGKLDDLVIDMNDFNQHIQKVISNLEI